MKHTFSPTRAVDAVVRFNGVIACVLGLLALGGCGGGGSNGPPLTHPVATCSTDAQKDWLRSYMFDQYLWSGSSPNPVPQDYASLPSYFAALLYLGDSVVPADKWSYISDAASYTQYFSEGKTLGYGLFVNGLELKLPLKVRYIEALSPAATQGLLRGDLILTVNGRPAADLIESNDFSALNPANVGDALVLEIRNTSGTRTVTLNANVYTLTPVPTTRVLTLSDSRKVGYLVLKDFITQAEVPLEAAFNDFRAAGARDVILDLRYNGGGRITTATLLASLVAGRSHSGRPFASLNFNTKQASQNATYSLSSSYTGFERVVVLTGARTCSASELVVNGLKPYTQVITVGAQTCGKPFGFIPVTSCSSTFSAVNFEAFNARGEGRYYDGIVAACRVSDDFVGQFGDPAEALTAAATHVLQNGACPADAGRPPVLTSRIGALSAIAPAVTSVVEPGEWRGMWAD